MNYSQTSSASLSRALLAAEKVSDMVTEEHQKLNLPIIEYKDGKIVESSPFEDRVFISYTRESEAHINRVRNLVKSLKHAGISVIFDEDQPPGGPPTGWPVWSANEAELAPRVLVVFTKIYEKCWRGEHVAGVRDGATHEAMSLANRVYAGGARTDFLRVVIFDPADAAHIPFRLRGLKRFDGEKEVDQIAAWLREATSVAAPVRAEDVLASKPKERTFLCNGPVTGEYFVGRRKECRDFTRMLENMESLNLLGDARIGKSSLLRKWQEIAHIQGHQAHIVDLQEIHPTISAFVCAATGNAIVLEENSNVENAADSLLDWCKRQSKPPVILVDECEELIRNIELRFFERLRGMMTARKALFVFTSRSELHEVFKDCGKTSPFANLTFTQRLGLLDAASACSLAAKAREYAGVLSLWAGRHPYYLQCLGYFLEQVADDYPVEDALGDFQDTAFQRLSELAYRLNAKEMAILRDAAAGNFVMQESLHRRGLLDNQQLFGKILWQWMQERALRKAN